MMNKYIEIIRKALLGIICSSEYEDSLEQDDVIKIFDIVFESMSHINENWADQREYQDFLELLTKFGNENNPLVIKICESIDEYHKSLLSECESDPKWKKFDSFGEDSNR